MRPGSWQKPCATGVPPPRNGRICPSLGVPWSSTIAASSPPRLGGLRGKLKYRPVVFELLPPEFTLYDLQQTVEAISGTLLHKQNFRRLVEKGGLVEATGNVSTETGGRPARLYRFRREVVLERPAPGLASRRARLNSNSCFDPVSGALEGFGWACPRRHEGGIERAENAEHDGGQSRNGDERQGRLHRHVAADGGN